jgi:hypothetical protein
MTFDLFDSSVIDLLIKITFKHVKILCIHL